MIYKSLNTNIFLNFHNFIKLTFTNDQLILLSQATLSVVSGLLAALSFDCHKRYCRGLVVYLSHYHFIVTLFQHTTLQALPARRQGVLPDLDTDEGAATLARRARTSGLRSAVG